MFACLLSGYDTGRMLREGISCAIVGKPNAGKSTLMNSLAGQQRSIVSDIEGTTRDIVEETIALGDIVLRVADCAGIRDTDDAVEKIGVDIMLKKLENADIVLAVFDGSRELSGEDREILMLRYFRRKTQCETAQILGMTQVMVSRRERKLLKELREQLV